MSVFDHFIHSGESYILGLVFMWLKIINSKPFINSKKNLKTEKALRDSGVIKLGNKKCPKKIRLTPWHVYTDKIGIR